MKKISGKLVTKIGILFLTALVGIAGGFALRGHETMASDASGSAQAVSTPDTPLAIVQTVPVRRKQISREIAAYGTVLPAPAGVRILSVPFKAEILAIYVREGRRILRGENLFEVRPSPGEMLGIKTAGAAYKTAEKLLQKTEEQVRLKLATREDLIHARQAFEEAKFRLKSLEKRGIAERVVIHSPADGIVSHVLVKSGDRLSAGASILEVTPRGAVEVRLGGEPEDFPFIHPGYPVVITPVNRPGIHEISGTVRSVSRIINPSTRLLDVFVTVPPSSPLLLNEYVRGRIRMKTEEGLVVPRSAVLREGDQSFLFTVANHRAVKHQVSVGLENGDEIEIMAKDLAPGGLVVTLGNYELKDGMAVRVEGRP